MLASDVGYTTSFKMVGVGGGRKGWGGEGVLMMMTMNSVRHSVDLAADMRPYFYLKSQVPCVLRLSPAGLR